MSSRSDRMMNLGSAAAARPARFGSAGVLAARAFIALPGLMIGLAAGAAGCQSPAPTTHQSITQGLGANADIDGDPVNQLEFLDRLERKAVTTWDEMLAGILISANKRVGPDYSARLGQARSFGLVGLDAPESGDTPATPAAFARALLRARGERFDPRMSSDALVTTAQQRGLLPMNLSANDILRGELVVGSLVALGEPTTRSNIPTRSAVRAGTGAGASGGRIVLRADDGVTGPAGASAGSGMAGAGTAARPGVRVGAGLAGVNAAGAAAPSRATSIAVPTPVLTTNGGAGGVMTQSQSVNASAASAFDAFEVDGPVPAKTPAGPTSKVQANGSAAAKANAKSGTDVASPVAKGARGPASAPASLPGQGDEPRVRPEPLPPVP